MTTGADPRRVHCNTCGGVRNHKVLCVDKERWESEEDESVHGTITHEMLKCAGCDGVLLRRSEWCSEDHPDDPQRDQFYPPRSFRAKPEWLTELWLNLPSNEDVVTDLLNEVYVALQNEQLRLAAMGIRAVLEQVMVAKVGDKGSFVRNIAAFEAAGYVSRLQRERLEAILEVGHAAIHRGYSPMRVDLITLVDITEVIVETIYLHGDKVEALKRRVPARKPAAP